MPLWLTLVEAEQDVAAGVSVGDWADTWKPGEACDLVLAFSGDIFTLEAMAAAFHCDKLKYQQESNDDEAVLLPYGHMRYCLHFKYSHQVTGFMVD